MPASTGTPLHVPKATNRRPAKIRHASWCSRLARCYFAKRTCRSVGFSSASRMIRVNWSRWSDRSQSNDAKRRTKTVCQRGRYSEVYDRPPACWTSRMTGQRRLAAILVADVVGYSKLMGSDEGARWLSWKHCGPGSSSPRSPSTPATVQGSGRRFRHGAFRRGAVLVAIQ